MTDQNPAMPDEIYYEQSSDTYIDSNDESYLDVTLFGNFEQYLRAAPVREAIRVMAETLQTLSCLGNGNRPGNSDGNVIAQQALNHPAVKPFIEERE